MKTKNKILASLEIAVVLCSVFLMAIPAIAAQEQNQEMQKASASEVTTASEDDYVLGVYGNANKDDTIDMRDLTYVKLIFFGKKSETELADAKYDGKINPLDFIQIKLIIVGKEKELTIVDGADRIVTVKKPIERAFIFSGYQLVAIRMLGATDKVVGVTTWIKNEKIYYGEFNKLPIVGTKDYEAILSLNPDLVGSGTWNPEERAKKLPGIPVVALDLTPCKTEPRQLTDGLVKLGYIFGKKVEASYYIEDFHDKYLDLIKARTLGLSEEERPKVYVEAFYKPYKVYPAGLVEIAGGRDIFGDLSYGADIDPEALLEKNPDIIIKKLDPTVAGYGMDDLSKAKVVRDEIMSRPELAEVKAVKNGRVYTVYGKLCYGPRTPIATAYYAKLLHPDLFEDLDPQGIHQEYIDRFCPGLDFDVFEHGVFVYPEPS